MPRYKWTGAGTFRDRRNEREVEPGDVVELDEHVGGPNRELVEVGDEDDERDIRVDVPESLKAEIERSTSPHPFDPGEHSVDEVEERLADVDDPGAVYAIAALEIEDGGRADVRDAVEARLQELAAPEAVSTSEAETVEPEGTDNLEIANLEVEPPVDPNEYTIGELEDALEDVSLSDAEREALLEAERADGDERVGAIEAIEGA